MQNTPWNFKAWMFPVLLLFLVHSMFFPMESAGQTLAVKGVLSVSDLPVRYAIVTFVSAADTTKKTSVLTDTSGYFSVSLPTSVGVTGGQPVRFGLEQNYPNPFTSATAIAYTIDRPSDIQVAVYDILGREIARLDDGVKAAGSHGVSWDGKNRSGERVPNGIYIYRVRTEGLTLVRKMVVGAGGGGTFALPLRPPQARASDLQKSAAAVLDGGTYTIRVANADATFPEIVPQQFGPVVFRSDTTLNLTAATPGVFPDANAAIIYPGDPRQPIRGFGGANILRWRPDMTPAQVQTAFGSGEGQLGFTILRLRVPYVATPEEFAYQVPTAKLAASLGAIVFASPWTPPPAMKSNNNIVGGTLKTNSYADYAAHLKGFADYMAEHGVPLYAVSLQNEPDANVTYESCSWNGTQFLNFMKNNAASIGPRIIMPESQNFVRSLSDPTLNDSAACANTAIIGGHIYGGGPTPYPLAESKGKEIWMTEHLVLDTTWTANLGTGKEISDCMQAGWNAYVWWYIVRYYGPVAEDGQVSKRGYVMSQFARFVRPGSIRVHSIDNAKWTLVDVTAFRKDSRLILVAVNRNSKARKHTFTLWNGTAGAFTPYVTSKTKNCELQGAMGYKNGNFTYTLEPLSVTTFISN